MSEILVMQFFFISLFKLDNQDNYSGMKMTATPKFCVCRSPDATPEMASIIWGVASGDLQTQKADWISRTATMPPWGNSV